MPIVHADAPEKAEELLLEHLPVVLLGPGAHRHGAEDINLEQVHVSDPHVGYHFRLDDLLEGKSLASAKKRVYRYFVYLKPDPANDGGEPEPELLGIAQVAIRGKDQDNKEQVEWAGLSSGPTAEAKIRKLIDAEQEIGDQDEGGTVKFEFRGLHAPAVRFAAIWLHAEKGDESQEIIIPIDDHPSNLHHDSMYEWAEVVDALHPAAKQAQIVHDASQRIP